MGGLDAIDRKALGTGMLIVRDPKTHIEFMVDSGSRRSVIPCHRPATHPSVTEFMSCLNGSEVPTFESVELELSLNLGRSFTWTFVKADVLFATLGLDFLTHFVLLVDARRGRLVLPDENPVKQPYIFGDTRSSEAVAGTSPEIDCPSPPVCIDSEVTPIQDPKELFDRYSEVFDLENFKKPARHKTKHFINTRGPPACQRVRRLSPEKLEILRVELQKLQDLNVIEPANSPYGSPVHLVPKKNGSYRVTGDFRLLNKQTVPDRYALPLLTDFVDFMSGTKHFSSLDLYKSYHQIEIAEQDIPKTAMVTPLGSFCFRKMPMGLCNAGASFQRFVNEVLRGLPFVFVYIDDVLIFSKSREEHMRYLTLDFDRIKYFGLILNKDKCIFDVKEIVFLGHKVNREGVAPLESKVTAIQNFPRPSNMKQLRRFLGMLNYYRRFIPAAAATLQPLNRMLSPRKYSRQTLRWNEEAEQAFSAIKTKLANATLLAFPVLGAETQVVVDASTSAIGGVLQQVIDGHAKPLAFFSKGLNSAQVNYSVFDRELLAMYLSLRHFRYFLEGRAFTLFTDHKPLVSAVTSPMKQATARQLRQLSYVAQLTADVRYISGENNVVADCLSRPPDLNALCNAVQAVDFTAMSRAQQTDDSIITLLRTDHSLKIVKESVPGCDQPLLGDFSQGVFRPLVPVGFRKKVFDSLHALSHPGVRASQKLVGQRFVWFGMRSDIRAFVQTCIKCQQAKVIRHNRAPLHSFKAPNKRFAHIHVDIVGPLPVSHDYSYLLSIICRFTRHVELIPLRDVTATECANAFLLHWVGRFGCPTQMTTDRGRQFTSYLWKEMCEFLGTKLSHTTAYHPAANGMVERVHRTVKTALKCNDNPTAWYENLGLVLLGIHSTVKEDFGCSSSELTLGTTLRLPGQFFSHSDETVSHTAYRRRLLTFMKSLKPSLPREPCRRSSYLEKALRTCTHVFVRDDGSTTSLQPAYTGPFPVLDKEDKYFILDLGDRTDSVSIDRLKAAHMYMPQHLNCQEDYEVHDGSTAIEIPSIATNVGFSAHPDEEPAPEFRSRRGRTIRLPVRYRRSLDD